MDYKTKCQNFKDYMERTSDLAIDAYKYKLLATHSTSQAQREEYHNMHNTLLDLYHKEIQHMTTHME